MIEMNKILNRDPGSDMRGKRAAKKAKLQKDFANLLSSREKVFSMV